MRRASRAFAGALCAAGLLLGALAPGCGAPGQPPIDTGGGVAAEGDGGFSPDANIPNLAPPACHGYDCTVQACSAGATTTISGAVFDPAGQNPLHNVVVYVPASPPSALATGASCDSCDSLYTGGVVAVTITDADGNFALSGVPAGESIPIVVQIGKWRKQTTVANVVACKNNPLPSPLTLPASQSDGDIPNIAISTGGADSLECLLTRIGIDPAEYSVGAAGPGRIHIFQGSSPGTPSAATTSPPAPLSSQALWNSLGNLMPYDITILSCEGAETVDQPGSTPITADDQQNLLAYTAAGGRLFASHFHYAWFVTGPFAALNIATWTRGANPITEAANDPVTTIGDDFINANVLTTLADGGPFPKGQVMAQWLANVNALNGSGEVGAGEVRIDGAKHNADLVGLSGSPSQGWLAADQTAQTEYGDVPGEDAGPIVSAAGAIEYLSFNTPVDAGLDDAGQPAYCGRVVYSDLHVGAASGDYGGEGAGGIVPSGCAAGELSPQEKVLEYMLFDLSSCVTSDTGPPQQPIPAPLP